MRQASYTLTVESRGKGLVDISEIVEAHVRDSRIEIGLATLFCRHTSAFGSAGPSWDMWESDLKRVTVVPPMLVDQYVPSRP